MTASTITRLAGATGVRSLSAAPSRTLAVVLGGIGFLVSFIGIGNPSLWGDEAASVLSAERPLPSLFRMLGHVDAVHGTYYLFLHYWIRVFGTSELSLRLPSAVAVGILVAGVFVVGSQLASRRLAVVAAIVCAVLPRIDQIGADARSYAMSTAVAVWLTVLLVRFVHRGVTSRLAWLGYAVLLAAGLYFFLYLAFVAVVHGLYLLLRQEGRGLLRRWLQSVAVAVVLAAPVLVYGYLERSQLAFLKSRDYAQFWLIVTTQWFGAPLFAAAAWVCIALALVAGILIWRRHRVVSEFALLAVLWLVVPTVLLLALNTVTPSYNLRYLSQSAPAAALVIAAGIVALRRRWLVAAATVAVVGLAMPTDIAQRGPYADDEGSDWRQASQVVAATAHPGDAVLFDDTVRNSRLPRLAMRMYPQDYRGLDDVELVTPYYDTAGLWDVTAPLDRVTGRLATTKRVILLGSHDHGTAADVTTLENLGFEVQQAKTVNRTVVYTLTRGTP